MENLILLISDHKISTILFFIFLFAQWWWGTRPTYKKIKELNRLFPKEHFRSKDKLPQILPQEGFPLYNSLCEKINAYITQNDESIDLEEMKDIITRQLDKEFSDATSKLSVPMYLGLAGTYLGVGWGLGNLIWKSIENSNQMFDTSAVYSFIGGVVIAMATSLVGLIMTIWANGKSSQLENKLESEKDKFFCFLQTEILPSLPSTLAQTLQEQLQRPIHELGGVVTLLNCSLRDTFEKATTEFGKNLTQNFRELNKMTECLSIAAKVQAEALNKQDSIITRISRPEFSHLLERIIYTSERSEEAIRKIEKGEEGLILLQKRAADTQQALISAQEQSRQIVQSLDQATLTSTQQFCQLMQKPENLYLHIDRTLQEFARFQDFIAEFTAIEERDKIQYVQQIDAQLQGIKEAGEVINRYLSTTNKELISALEKQKEAILLQMNHFEEYWREFFVNMEGKRGENPLNHLEKLSELNYKMDQILSSLGEISQHSAGDEVANPNYTHKKKGHWFSNLFRKAK